MQPPQSYSIRGQRSSRQLTGKPAGARPDYTPPSGRRSANCAPHPGSSHPRWNSLDSNLRRPGYRAHLAFHAEHLYQLRHSGAQLGCFCIVLKCFDQVTLALIKALNTIILKRL
ncbi:UNVERIFIED_CONTAM: hypothetical protein FKN15_069503 [Acipenser sinensis]